MKKTFLNTIIYILISTSTLISQNCSSSFDFTQSTNPNRAVQINSINPQELYNLNNGFTWECWFNLSQLPNNGALLISAVDNLACNDITLGFNWPTNNNLNFMVSDNNTNCGGTRVSINSGNFVFNRNQWYHAAAVCDYINSLMVLYIDGNEVSRAPIVIPLANRMGNNVAVFIGNEDVVLNPSGTTSPFTGLIDEVRFWDIPRTHCEIADNMNTHDPSNPAQLVGYFHADEGNANISTSITGTPPLTATLINGAAWGLDVPNANWGIDLNRNTWLLNGNTNTRPKTSAINIPIIPANENFIGTSDNNRLVIGTGGTTGVFERMTILNNSGNVGIGTTDPLHRFQIVDNILNRAGAQLIKAPITNPINFDFSPLPGNQYPRPLGFGALVGQGYTNNVELWQPEWYANGYPKLGSYIGSWYDVNGGNEGTTNITGVISMLRGSGSGKAFGFYSNLSNVGTGYIKYGFYSQGEDRNYFSGNVGIGSTGPFTYSLTSIPPFSGGTVTTTGTLKLDVNGIVRCTGIFATSDEKLKTEIKSIENSNSIISKLNGKTYYWSKEYSQDASLDNSRHYGFLAQELEKIMPEAVIKDENGRYAVEYNSIIPVLVESQKELIKKNEELKSKLVIYDEKFALLEKSLAVLCESGCAGLEKLGAKTTSDVDALYQSIPNPTDDVALINYYLTKEYTDAIITISTQDGKQIQSFKLEPKTGNGSVKVSLGSLASGTYLYTLVAGERVVDTKRLQIVK